MKVFDLILFLKILYSTNRQSYDDSDVDDYYDYDDHEDFGYCYDSDDGSTIYCFFRQTKDQQIEICRKNISILKN